MKLTNDESRALTFLAGLLILSAAVRLFGVPEPSDLPGGAMDLAAHVEATRTAVGEAERAAAPLAPGERIDPNRAPVVELDRLPRVGPALARRIVQDRDENGPFRTPEDLARVRGVGEAMVAALEEHLDLSSAPRLPVAGRARRMQGRVSRAGASAASLVPQRSSTSGPVDVNRADVEALTSLPGIGPVLAERIIAHRDSAGPFPDVDALSGVSGIGEATLERLRPMVTVGRR